MLRRVTFLCSWMLVACSSDEGSVPADDETAEAPARMDASVKDAGRKPTRDASPARDSGRATLQQLCKAGYYVGHMEGDYKPGFASLGLGASQLEVEFRSESLNGQPPLALTLEEEVAGSGEFLSFRVSGGCLQGLARSGVTDNPFVARLTGELDCRTGQFNGTMDGVYTLFNVSGLEYKFKGPITAQFADDSLSEGAWSASEPPALDGNPAGGGTGTWGATWNAEEAPDTDSDPCARIPLPADAG